MESGTESLAILDALLKEFFDYKTTNERKQEIETVLGEFGRQRDAWKHCIYYLNNTSSHFVCMFCLATLEKIITKQWLQLMWEERSQLRSLLYQYTLQRHAHTPIFIRNKLLKLVVDIARLDWPHFYPDFFTNILALMQNNETKVLGLAFLQTASEELICPREDLSVSRKDELKRLFLAHIPQVFSLIIGLFEEAKEKGGHSIVLAAMQALSHLFSWIPLADINSLQLLSLITHFASQPFYLLLLIAEDGRQVQTRSVTRTPSRKQWRKDACGLNGLSALNELLYNNCVPATFQNSLLSLCIHNNTLLRAALGTNMANIDPEYIAKLTEMTRLCVSVHWHRVESSPGFPVLEFLSSLFQYTFQQPTLDMFYSTLDIWNSLLDYLQLKETTHIAKYEEVLVSLVHALLKKLQGHRNLDNENLDTDMYYVLQEETERQKFLRQGIEVIAKVAELAPTQTCSLVLECWQPVMSQYSGILCGGMPGVDELGSTLIDCAALTQAVARLYGQMLAAAVPHNLASLFANLAAQATQARLHDRQQFQHVIKELVELHCQVVAGLVACMCESIVETSLTAVMPLLTEPAPPKLQHSAAHALNAVCLQRAPHRSLDQLYTLFTADLSHLPKQTLSVVYCALVRCLLSWKWESDASRLQLLAGLVDTMMPQGVLDLSHMTAVLMHCKPDTTAAKKLLFTSIQPVLQQVLNEFPRTLKTKPEQCDAMLTIFLEAFRSLQHQMGAQFTQRALHTFITCFTQYEVSEMTCGVDKLLELLTLVIEQPAASFKHFVPSCIALCLENILPSVTDATSPTVKPPLFQLLYSLMLHKWQYFYQGAINDCQPVLEHGDQLAAILTAFGQSLTQPDIALFSQNLQALEDVNHKWKLYHKDMFRVQFLALLLTVLLTSLINKSHALLSEEIATAVYNMAAVNFDSFYSNFLPQFLSQTSGLDDNQRDILRKNIKPETDLPSFTQNIFRLANDVRCYRLCNSGSPT